MRSLFDWLKNNKLTTVLILVVACLLLFRTNPIVRPLSTLPSSPSSLLKGAAPESASLLNNRSDFGYGEYAPQADVADRLVVETSSLSLLVINVSQTMDSLNTKVKSLGGYMVSQELQSPEEGQSGTLIVRVPVEKLQEALAFFRQAAVRVVSESLVGEDVTDQYTDINASLETLYTTKAKFEEIMTKATQVDDILRVQRELVSLQSQIDSLKGQADYLEKTSELAKVTLYLSTDELSLPYAPEVLWRPKVVFKLAVRSLVSSLRGVGAAAIWVVVYSVVWLPVLLAIVFVPQIIKKKRFKGVEKNE